MQQCVWLQQWVLSRCSFPCRLARGPPSHSWLPYRISLLASDGAYVCDCISHNRFQISCPIAEKQSTKLTNQIHHTFGMACIWLVILFFNECTSNLKLTCTVEICTSCHTLHIACHSLCYLLQVYLCTLPVCVCVLPQQHNAIFMLYQCVLFSVMLHVTCCLQCTFTLAPHAIAVLVHQGHTLQSVVCSIWLVIYSAHYTTCRLCWSIVSSHHVAIWPLTSPPPPSSWSLGCWSRCIGQVRLHQASNVEGCRGGTLLLQCDR